MAGISIQFHATPEELSAFIRQWLAEWPLHVIAARFHPFEAVAIPPDQCDAAMQDATVRRFLLTLRPPSVRARTMLALFDANPDALLIDIGRLSETGLKETWVTASTKDEASLGTWKQIAAVLRRNTRAGALVTNPETGESGRIREHRWTTGARELQRQGIAMLPAAGTARYTFPDE